jgi:hypothetical protein
MSSPPQTLLEWALDAHRRGWHMFPLAPRTKDKHILANGCVGATRDLEQIKRWWRTNPDLNPAVTGGVIVDVDEGLTSLAEAQSFALLNGLPNTLVVRTGRRTSYGAQFHFTGQAPNGRYEANGARGEIRCSHQYGLAPGAIHPSGTRYEVVVDLPIAPWPTNCVLNTKRQQSNRPIARNEKVREPGRHAYLVQRAAGLYGEGLDGNGLLNAVRWLNQHRCDPPKDRPHEIEDICAWVKANITPGLWREDSEIVTRLCDEDPKWRAAWEGHAQGFKSDADAERYLMEGVSNAGVTRDAQILRIVKASPLWQKLQENCPF